MKASTTIKFGQPSWRIATKSVEAFITETGGHVGPVTFYIGGRRIQPYAIAPWAQEKINRSLPSVLKVLRGDFLSAVRRK
jgi:hypothetical protein